MMSRVSANEFVDHELLHSHNVDDVELGLQAVKEKDTKLACNTAVAVSLEHM